MLALALVVLASSPPAALANDPIARFECARCHVIDGVAAPSAERSCVTCHRLIAAGTFDAPPEALARWRRDLRHLVDVPSLVGLSGRVRRGWLAEFLRAPHDLRPALEETMPRLPIGDDDARALARLLVPVEPDEAPLVWPAGATLARGGALFEERGCRACHAFGDVTAAPIAATKLAPDLRETRARMPPRALLRWLADPVALKPDTTMPRPALSDDERHAVARFVLEAPLAAVPTRPVDARLPPLARRVTWDEVNAGVFRKTCWHCHSDAALAGGDGGPGNTGGFGYPGRGLSLASYGDALAGGADDDGEPRSIFLPVDGVPRLVAHLLARRAEERGERPALVGMPLGLPALSPEEIQLVDSWIAQGRPR